MEAGRTSPGSVLVPEMKVLPLMYRPGTEGPGLDPVPGGPETRLRSQEPPNVLEVLMGNVMLIGRGLCSFC